MRNACDDWLKDPENPERYTLDPRATEVDVIYEEYEGEDKNGKPKYKRAKAALSTLLLRAEGKLDVTVERVHLKHADPRQLIVNTLDQLHRDVDTLAKLTGAYKKEAANPYDEQAKREKIYRVAQERYRRQGIIKTIEEEARELAQIERELDSAQDLGRIG